LPRFLVGPFIIPESLTKSIKAPSRKRVTRTSLIDLEFRSLLKSASDSVNSDPLAMRFAFSNKHQAKKRTSDVRAGCCMEKV